MSRQTVLTDKVPFPLRNASQAIICDGIVHCSGVLALEKGVMKVISGGIQVETRQILQDLSIILNEAGSSLADIIKMTIFLASMDDFKLMNEIYDEYFSQFDQKPCRTCVAVSQLALGAKVEIDCSALLKAKSKL